MTNTSISTTLHQASHQWAKRPADQRFVSLADLNAKAQFDKINSRAKNVSTRDLLVRPAKQADGNVDLAGLELVGPSGNGVDITHYAFGQLGSLSGDSFGKVARQLPSPLAADVINYGLKFNRDAEDIKVLLTSPEGIGNGRAELRAANGPNYGRIWNADISRGLVSTFGDGTRNGGDWQVPGEFRRQVPITNGNTTLYYGDRSLFVFLCDESRAIEDGPDVLARGFFVWNSEVGAASFGIAAFLYRYSCTNRIVWGAQGYREIVLRHTASAPHRWLEEAVPVLESYARSSDAGIVDIVQAAKTKRIDDVDKFLASRFTKPEVVAIKAAHINDESRPIETIWDATQGVTAWARSIPYQIERVAAERQGGQILQLAA